MIATTLDGKKQRSREILYQPEAGKHFDI